MVTKFIKNPPYKTGYCAENNKQSNLAVDELPLKCYDRIITNETIHICAGVPHVKKEEDEEP